MVDRYNIEYEIINVKDIVIRDDIKFDLICSFRSCGFHYPIKEYFSLIKKHKHESSLLLFDIRKNYSTALEDIKIIENLEDSVKHTRSIIKI